MEEIDEIEKGFENYEKADVTKETEKLQEAVIAKKMKKAELHLLEPLARVYENRHSGNDAPCGPSGAGPTHWMGS